MLNRFFFYFSFKEEGKNVHKFAFRHEHFILVIRAFDAYIDKYVDFASRSDQYLRCFVIFFFFTLRVSAQCSLFFAESF